MIGKLNASGFEEIAHTADWSVRVWAPDLVALLQQAAEAAQQLMGITLDGAGRQWIEWSLTAKDEEGLLVALLSEQLYILEQERLAIVQMDVRVDTGELTAKVEVAPVLEQQKEIKAVTYHQLKIQRTPTGLSTVVTFDV